MHPVENSPAFISLNPEDETFTKRDSVDGRETSVSLQTGEKVAHLTTTGE
jgi:predicted ATP-grasp superfamily ATP-dependent carboligase